LRELEKKGYRLGIVSSGTRSRVVREIGELELTPTFRVVVCNEDTVNKKPHPEGLEKAMLQLSCPKQSCSYIGDSPEDVQMGKNAEVLTVAIRSAYPSHKRLRHTNPDIYLEFVTEMLLHF
ncbi:MAG: HAD family hydrolase, partial [Gammaproteobacteria bacterium]